MSYLGSDVLSFMLILANVMKSMLQDLDNNLISKDNFIHEQNGKLFEKDKIIQNNKAEIERLEKRAKMQEHKVRDTNSQTSPEIVCLVDNVSQFLLKHGSVPD